MTRSMLVRIQPSLLGVKMPSVIKDKKIVMDIDDEVFGIPLTECFMCGKADSTRHHAIPRVEKPLRNVTIPLCEEHKNITHHIIKQFYIPKDIRRRLGKAIKELNNLEQIIKALKKDFAIYKAHKSDK